MLQHPFFSQGVWITDRWQFDGLQAIVMENKHVRVVVLPGKGADIIEFRHKPSDTNFMLAQPGGLRNPGRMTPSAYGDAPFLDYFYGGWNDVFPNGGPAVTYKGAALGQHGEASLLQWDYAITEQSQHRVAVKLWVSLLRTPFFMEKELSLDAGTSHLQLKLSVRNDGGEPLHAMWGQHIAFGLPFLQTGARIDVPACNIQTHGDIEGFVPRRFKPNVQQAWPHLPRPDGEPDNASLVPAPDERQAQEMAYLVDLTDGWYAITNPERQVGFGLHFDHTLFQTIWYWQQLGHVAQGYPWWARTHTAALEPWTSYPTNGLPESIENGSALLLAPGQTLKTEMLAAAYSGYTRINHIAADGTIQGE